MANQSNVGRSHWKKGNVAFEFLLKTDFFAVALLQFRLSIAFSNEGLVR
jgi:hypothetical protein